MCKQRSRLIFGVLAFAWLFSQAAMASVNATPVDYVSFVYGPVKSTDHLWRLARAMRPSKRVTLQQTMVAILNKNSASFTNYNVNSLKKGSLLYLPSIDEIEQVSPRLAQRIIARQNRQFHPIRKKPLKVTYKATNIANLDRHVTETQQEVFQLKETINKRLSEIEMQAHRLENQLKEENTQLATLTDKIVSLDKTVQAEQLAVAEANAKEKGSGIEQFSAAIATLLSGQITRGDLFLFSGAIVFVMLTGFSMIFGRYYRKKALFIADDKSDKTSSSRLFQNSSTKTTKDDDDKGKDKEEYDYWGSHEGVLAKLDLARAYIDMGELSQAKDTLKEVIERGNDPQKEEASRLLANLE